MDRREFLKKSSLVASGIFVAGIPGIFQSKVFPATFSKHEFSLDVITPEPERAIRRIEMLLAESPFKNFPIRFAEYRLPGWHVADIAFIRNRQLTDFRTASDPFSKNLAQIYRDLQLPARSENPVLLQFSSQIAGYVPRQITITRGDLLLEQLSIEAEKESYRIEGMKGHIELAIVEKKIRILSSTCKHKTCMKMGEIRHTGQSLVCIPNQVAISIAGESATGVDGVAF